jgi:basic membrane protein A and related proteins
MGAAACGGGANRAAADEPGPAAISAGLRKAQTGPIRVALVPGVGGTPEYRALAIKGLQDAIEKLRVRGQVVESTSASRYVSTMKRLGRQRYDLIITIGRGMASATHRAARAFPKTMFAIVDYAFSPARTLPNIEGLVFDEAQASYLAGYVAGMMSKGGSVSTVIAGKDPAARRLVAGFREGARATKRAIRTLGVAVDSNSRPATCRTAALRQIARGADVIFPVAGPCGRGALAAAADRGVWAVGLDVDQFYLGPHMLTSAVKKVDVAVFDAIQGVANGAVEEKLGTMSPYGFHGGGLTVYGVPYGGVGLGRVSPKVPPRVLARVDVIKRRMTGGAIVVAGAPGLRG